MALARVFGQGGIGDYTFAFALAGFFGLGVELGLPPLLTRKIAREPQSVHAYFGSVAALQVGLAVGLGLVLLGVCFALGFSLPLTALVLLAFGETILRGAGRSLAAYLEGVEAMDRSALLEVVSRVAVVAMGFALLLVGAPLTVIMAAHVLGGAVYLGLAYRWLVARFGRPAFRLDARLMRRTALAALPFVATVALYELYAKIDVMMLHRWLGNAEAGIYAVAVRLVTAPVALSFLAGLAMYPSLSRDTPEDRAGREALFLGTLRWLAVLGVAGGLVLAVVGDRLVLLLFDQAFEVSGRIVRWMSIVFVAQFMGTPYWRLLFAEDREKTVLRLQAASLTLNVALNIAFIPLWGVFGALWASVGSEVFIVCAFHLKAAGIVSARYGAKALRLGLAGGAGLATGLLARGLLAWPLAGAVALATFAAVGIALGLVGRRDVRALLGQASPRAA